MKTNTNLLPIAQRIRSRAYACVYDLISYRTKLGILRQVFGDARR